MMPNLRSTSVLIVLFAFILIISGSNAQEHTAEDKTQGMAHCFKLGLAGALARLQLNNEYVCTLNSQIGPLPSFDYSVFGPHHGYPIIQSEEPYFFETYYGKPDNGFVAINRVNTSTYDALGYYMVNETYRVAYYLDDQGELTDELFSETNTYVVTERPWYQGALNSASGSFVTSTPFRFSLVSLRVASSKQCKNESGQMEIIAGAGLTLETLSAMVLSSTTCPQFNPADGVAFVVNSEGILLMQNDAAITDIYPARNASGLVGATTEHVEGLNGGDWDLEVSGLFTYQGEEYESYTHRVTGLRNSHVDVSNWGWTVVIATKPTASDSSASSLRAPWM